MEDLWKLLKEHNLPWPSAPDKIEELLFHKDFTEEMAIALAENRRTPPECLSLLASTTRFRDSYRLKLALCKNPKTPQRVTLSLIKFLRLFDLADLTRNQNIHINIRQKIEQVIKEKIPSLPLGNRITLAKRASSAVVIALLERAKGKNSLLLINTCLSSPVLKEGDILKLINTNTTPPEVLQAIAYHNKWSLRYWIRYALVRNFYTPLSRVVEFLKEMKTQDLEELYKDEVVPSSTRPFIYREIMERSSEIRAERADLTWL